MSEAININEHEGNIEKTEAETEVTSFGITTHEGARNSPADDVVRESNEESVRQAIQETIRESNEEGVRLAIEETVRESNEASVRQAIEETMH